MAEVARDSENDPLDSASNLIADSPPGLENAATREHLPQEWWKTLVMLLYMLICMFCMTVTMVIVHDHVPDQNTTMYLKDVAWNITSDWPTGVRFCFRATEVAALLLCALTGWHLVSSKFRSVLLRRFFFHLGTIYLYRIFSISFTILPVPKLPMNNCTPKTDGSVGAILSRALNLLLGAGMDITGTNMCGDYIYSGHTSMLTSTTLFILEYTPQKYIAYRILCQMVAVGGVVCIVFSHEHYTIDILFAYYVCTNHFWIFHALANDRHSKTATPRPWRPGPHLTRVWWWRIFLFMERNVPVPLECAYENPLRLAKDILRDKWRRKTMENRTPESV